MSARTMIVSLVVCVAVSMLHGPKVGAQEDRQVQELRRLYQELGKRLETMESNNGTGDDRIAQIGRSGSRQPVEHREPEVILRMYDLSDLFAASAPYPAEYEDGTRIFPSGGSRLTGGSGGMGGMFNVPGRDRNAPASIDVQRERRTLWQWGTVDAARASMDGLIEGIQNSISPESWDSSGGKYTIGNIGTALLVSADENTHQQIAALLGLFRKRWGTLRTVTTQVYWLWLDDKQLAGLLGAQPGGAVAAKAGGSAIAIDREAWQKLLASLAETDEGRTGYRAATTCYNGQTVHARSGLHRSRVLTSTSTETKERGGERTVTVTQTPVVVSGFEGAVVELTPLSNSSGKFVMLDIHSRVVIAAPENEAAPREDAAEQAKQHADVELPLMIHRLSTTLRVPVGAPVLVGGMSFEVVPRAGEPALYLFVETSVQDVRDEEQEETIAEEKADDSDDAGELDE